MSRKASFRLLLVLAGVVTASMLLVGTGSAKPPPSASVSIVCDKGVGTATVTIDLRVSLFVPTVVGGPATYTCGPDSTSGLTRVRDTLTATQAYGWVTATVSMTTAAGPGGCFLGGVPTLKDTCQIDSGAGPAGPAVSITIR